MSGSAAERPGKVKRGEVYLLNFSSAGGRLHKERPVLVVQNDVGNEYSAETIVAALRDAGRGRTLPIFVALSRGEGGLAKASRVDAGHVLTIGQDQLGRRLGRLTDESMRQVERALKISLGLI